MTDLIKRLNHYVIGPNGEALYPEASTYFRDTILDAVAVLAVRQEERERLRAALAKARVVVNTYACEGGRVQPLLTEIDAALSPAQADGLAVPAWQDMSSAPKDGTRFIAVESWPSGNIYVRVYRWEGPPNYWNSDNGTCIRPEYQDKYRWAPLPPAPAQAEGA